MATRRRTHMRTGEVVINRGFALTRQQLGELKAELLRERGRLERLTQMDGDTDVWMASGAAVGTLVERRVSAAVQTRTHTRYDAIVNALRRVATRTYGMCMGCDRPIPYGRLLAMPEALHCITCGSRM